MENSRSTEKHLVGLASAIIGTGFLTLLLVLFNTYSEKNDDSSDKKVTRFEIKKTPPPPKNITQKQKPKLDNNPPPAPLIDSGLLNSELAGIDLNLWSIDNNQSIDKGLLGNTDDAVLSGDLVDTAPVAKIRTPIQYPSRAKAREIEGYVVLNILVNRAGKVKHVKVLESEPRGIFESSAERTIKNWIFEPAKYKGKSVDSWANLTIRFELG